MYALSSLVIATLGLFANATFALPASFIAAKASSSSSLPTKKSLYVDGKHIPGISKMTGDLGASYAGLLPVTPDASDNDKFFFWYWPTDRTAGKDDVVVWLNGGPGCSSLEGVFGENGPLTLTEPTKDVYKATRNPYSWHHLSHVLYVEQPVSVGLGSGTPDIVDEVGVATEFYGFLQNFYKTFPELKSKKLWLTGESYAGMYIPYMADYIYQQNDTLNLQGFAVSDPSIGNTMFGQDVPALAFARANQKTLKLSRTQMTALEEAAEKNGVTNFLRDHLVFPPRVKIYAPQQLQPGSLFNDLWHYSTVQNPCISVYYIDDQCPADLDPLGFPLDSTTGASTRNFINRTPGFKKYVHADPKTSWVECTTDNVFAGNGEDNSLAPADSELLGRVINKNQRTVIQHGLRDMILMANGTLLAIQNTTWSDAGSGGTSSALQGFQGNFFANKGNLKVNGKSTGQYITERGLTFATVDKAGHMVPTFTPATAYKLQKYLLGQIAESDLGT